MKYKKKIILNNYYFSKYLIQKIFYITDVEITIFNNKEYLTFTDSLYCKFTLSDNKFESFNNQPAIIIPSEKFTAWLYNDKFHRNSDDPAVTSHFNEFYFYHGKNIQKGQYKLFEKTKNF